MKFSSKVCPVGTEHFKMNEFVCILHLFNLYLIFCPIEFILTLVRDRALIFNIYIFEVNISLKNVIVGGDQMIILIYASNEYRNRPNISFPPMPHLHIVFINAAWLVFSMVWTFFCNKPPPSDWNITLIFSMALNNVSRNLNKMINMRQHIRNTKS